MKTAQASARAVFAFGGLVFLALAGGDAFAREPVDPWGPAPAAPSGRGAATSAAIPAPPGPADPAGTSPALDASSAMFEQLQSMRALIENLTGRIEELENAQRQAREEQKARYLDLDARLNALAAAGTTVVVPTTTAGPVVSTAAGSGPAPVANAERNDYDAAKQLVLAGKYTDAAQAFARYLQKYPRGEYMADVLYWSGEMWLVVDKPDPAKAQRYFARVPNEFPRSDKASAATYKIGLLQCQSGDRAAGRVTLNRVKVQYATSPEARLVGDALTQYCK